jgi:hypothetical protein
MRRHAEGWQQVEKWRAYSLWLIAFLLTILVAVVAVRLLRVGNPLQQALAAIDDGHAHVLAYDASQRLLLVGSHDGLMAGPSPRYLKPVAVLQGEDVMALAPADGALYLGGHRIGVASLREGSLTTLYAGDIHALAARGSRLVAWVAEHALIVSDDGGANWTSRGAIGLEVLALSLDPNDPDRIAAGGYRAGGGAVALSSDGGRTWQVNGGIDNVTGLVHDPTRPGFLYAAAGGILWASSDGGVTWSRRFHEPGREIVAVAFERRRSKASLLLLTADGKVFEPAIY